MKAGQDKLDTQKLKMIAMQTMWLTSVDGEIPNLVLTRGLLGMAEHIRDRSPEYRTILDVAGGMQQLRNMGTAFGDIVQVPSVSGRNAALQGTADVLNAYARQIQEAIARDGFYVRVPAGKQFYLYVTETIDQAKGVRGNQTNEQIWRRNNEK